MPPAGPAGGPVPPPMPMRARGGKVMKVDASKGSTPVQHAPNKQDGKNIGRGPVITKATGGAVEARSGMAPHAMGGSGGGKSRMDKQNHPSKYTC